MLPMFVASRANDNTGDGFAVSTDDKYTAGAAAADAAERSDSTAGSRKLQAMQPPSPSVTVNEPMEPLQQQQHHWPPFAFANNYAALAGAAYGGAMSPNSALWGAPLSASSGAWPFVNQGASVGAGETPVASASAAAGLPYHGYNQYCGWYNTGGSEVGAGGVLYHNGLERIPAADVPLVSYNAFGSEDVKPQLRYAENMHNASCDGRYASAGVGIAAANPMRWQESCDANNRSVQSSLLSETGAKTTSGEEKTRTRDKYRVVYTDYQRSVLENEFNTSPYVKTSAKAHLSKVLQLSERQIKIWFQNRRAKDRKLTRRQAEVSGGVTPAGVHKARNDNSKEYDCRNAMPLSAASLCNWSHASMAAVRYEDA